MSTTDVIYGDDFAAASAQLMLENDTSPSARPKKLAAGRIDVAMLNSRRASFVSSAGEVGLRTDDFTVLPKPLSAPLQSPRRRQGCGRQGGDLARVNKAIAKAAADGTVGKIMDKYDQ